MTERPILFSGPMVRALLDGTKTQTRRVITPVPFDCVEERVQDISEADARAEGDRGQVMRDDRKDGAERAEPTKALSIQQPWAWLVVNGYKDIENRDWNTKFRGRFYVHAGKKVDGDAYERLRHRFPLPRAADIERGGIVGEATLVGVVDDRLQTSSEWFTGYYGFVLGSPKPLPFRPLRGQLGFFDVPRAALTALGGSNE